MYLFVRKSKRNTTLTIKNIDYTPKKADYYGIAYELYLAINMHRQQKGLNSLKSDVFCTVLSTSHNEYMMLKGKASHYNFPKRQAELSRRGALSVGEVVAYGFNSSEGFLNGYLNSKKHKKIIEGKSYTHFGMKISSLSNGRNYNTIMFSQFPTNV
jgi:uncharacterized protein YkwD